jgi:hypothetical protein
MKSTQVPVEIMHLQEHWSVKAFCTSFYWPTALKDTEELIKKYKGCQIFARQTHILGHNLICIPPA